VRHQPARGAEAVALAITELKAANVTIPVTLHRTAHALSYAMASRPEPPPRQA